jgi:hypothetical protein
LFTLVVVAAAGTHPPPPLFFLSGPWWWPEKSRHDRKSAGALFWHLNWPDHPEVYIMGRVRPEKKKYAQKGSPLPFWTVFLFDLGSGC